MSQSAFTNQHVGQTCSWCHTNALIKLGLISQFSSASASSSLPYLPPPPNFPACPLHYSHLQSSSWSQLCGTWTNCSKAPITQISSLQCHTFTCKYLLFLPHHLLMKSRGSCALSQSLRRPWDWKTLLQSKREPTWHAPTQRLYQMQTHTDVHTYKKPVFFSTRQSISARLTSLP